MPATLGTHGSIGRSSKLLPSSTIALVCYMADNLDQHPLKFYKQWHPPNLAEYAA